MATIGSSKTRVLTIGAGALGVLYSFLLEKGGQAEVTLAARSNYEAVLKRGGIAVQSAKYGNQDAWMPTKFVQSADALSEQEKQNFDYILCTSKCTPDVTPLSTVIRPFLCTSSSSKVPTLVLIQNGVGIEDEVYKTLVLKEKLVGAMISCCAWVGCNAVENGTKIEHGALEKLDMGLFPTPSSSESSATSELQGKLDHFVKIYRAGGGDANPVADIQPNRWRKLLWNAAWGGLCATSRQPLAALISNEQVVTFTIPVVRKTMLEVLAVARACGYGEDVFPASAVDDAVNIIYNKNNNAALKPDFKPSILLDLEAGRPMETIPIFENVISKARLHKVDTPRLDTFMGSLQPCQQDAIARAHKRYAATGAPITSITTTTDIVKQTLSPRASPSKQANVPILRASGVPVPAAH